ncbi:MAG: exopolysaccharide biosynthesis polyprenyl glycosylphosphotransferase [Kiritimatiellae bacterium]|nr:exopolysaccharide biosynthesis polyprenyl glycosylphosphotransferase [Kiritimatiellia bacterium]
MALGFADITCISVMWTVVVFLYWALGQSLTYMGVRTAVGGYSPQDYFAFWPVAICFVVVNALFDNYHGNWMYPSAPLSPVEEFRRLFGASVLTHLGVIAFIGLRYQTTESIVSRFVVAASGILVAVSAQSFRNWIRAILFRLKWGQIPVVLAGAGDAAVSVATVLNDDPHCGLHIVGYFNGTERLGRRKRRCEWNEREFQALGIPYLGTLRDILPEAKKRDIKTLIACQDDRLFRRQMEEFTSWFTFIEYLPTARTFPVFGSRAVVFDGLGGLEMVNQARMKAKRFQKRVLDTVFAAVAFVGLLPFFVVLPALIKLTSHGPVFYRQERLGKNGKPIRVWKFRSMYADADARLAKLLASDSKIAAEWKMNFKLAHDPRVTPLGRFLRRTSLDELPQLFNVFSGEMALIGPRPIVEGEVAYYGDAYPVFSSVRPGVTGLWQVSGRSDTDYPRRVALDTYYVLNWSPWMDIWILVRTVYAVLFMRGAR